MTTSSKAKSGLHPMTRILKWLIPLAVITALAALAFAPRPVEVDAGTVALGNMSVTVDDDGETRIRERYTISAPLAGQLLRINLNPGEAVNKDDTLSVITPTAPSLLDPRARLQARARVNAASAAVTSAQRQLDARNVQTSQLEKAYHRSKRLHADGNISDAEFEQSEGAFLAAQHSSKAAASAVTVAEFELKQAQAALVHFDQSLYNTDKPDDDHFIIRSPIHGQVLSIAEKSTRSVLPGTQLLTIGNPRDLEIRIDVLSQDAVNIKPGLKVIIRDWGGANDLLGRVRLVEPSAFTKISALGVDEQRVNIIADFTQPPPLPETLGDGFRLEAGIIIWQGKDVLCLPTGALFRQGKDWAVYKIDGKHARLTIIEIGHNNGDVAEILSGLADGDQVILHPSDRIKEGTPIKPRP